MNAYKQSKHQRAVPLEEQTVRSCIRSGLTNDALAQLEKFGCYIGKELKNEKGEVTTSQIRQPFSKMKTIEAKGINSPGQWLDFMMLKPYLAYAAGRHRKSGLYSLKDRLIWAIDEVLKAEAQQADETDIENEKARRFKNFCKFFEAILAYHRAAGGS
jgi:CRISPR-associated protein Csm2